MHEWAREFLEQLAAARPLVDRTPVTALQPSLMTALLHARRSTNLRLLVDYDGTVVPLARSPELAAPDAELLELLEALGIEPGIRLDIVSGRARETLETWLGHLPVSLWAEHGFWHRPYGANEWQPVANVAPDWMTRIRRIFEQFTASTPGSQVETKSASIAWHYRRAQREFAIHWAWSALAYHVMFFQRINPAAWLFAALFLIQAALFFWWGAVQGRLRFVARGSSWAPLAWVFIGYALVYPAINAVQHSTLWRTPLFAVPCPTTIFTAGLLMLAAPSWRWSAVPIIWSAVGGSAVLLDVYADYALPLSGVALAVFSLRRRKEEGRNDHAVVRSLTAHGNH